MEQTEQQFLNDLDKKLWTSANKLLPALDAAVYKHVVLGLIFLKYVSDAFEERREELAAHFRDEDHDYYLGDDEELIAEELEVRDYYTEKNVFWVPELARWKTLQDNAKLPIGSEIEIKNGKTTTYKITSVGRLIDDALDAIEYETRLGDAALMPPNVTACLGRRMGLLRPDTDKVIPEFLLYAYLSPLFQETIRSKTIHGATVDRIALKEMPSFPIRILPIKEQLRVVGVLKALGACPRIDDLLRKAHFGQISP